VSHPFETFATRHPAAIRRLMAVTHLAVLTVPAATILAAMSGYTGLAIVGVFAGIGFYDVRDEFGGDLFGDDQPFAVGADLGEQGGEEFDRVRGGARLVGPAQQPVGFFDDGQVRQAAGVGLAAVADPQVLDKADQDCAHEKRLVVVVADVFDLDHHAAREQLAQVESAADRTSAGSPAIQPSSIFTHGTLTTESRLARRARDTTRPRGQISAARSARPDQRGQISAAACAWRHGRCSSTRRLRWGVSHDEDRPARIEDVHELALDMPYVTVEYGTGDNPVYQVGRKSFIFFRNPRPDAVDPDTGQRYADVIVFWVESEADKQALVQDETSPFFTTAHFDDHLSVLLRASRIGELTRKELAELIQDAWLSRASARRAAAWLKARSPT
jgi:hypothetical protein